MSSCCLVPTSPRALCRWGAIHALHGPRRPQMDMGHEEYSELPSLQVESHPECIARQGYDNPPTRENPYKCRPIITISRIILRQFTTSGPVVAKQTLERLPQR